MGKVTLVPTGSDGRVFFQQLTIANTGAYGQLDPTLVRPRISTPQNGIAAVDMPELLARATPSTTGPDAELEFPFGPGTFGARRSSWRAGSMLPKESTTFASAAWTRPTPPRGHAA